MIVVPSGQDELEIQISGGTGDCDLYVRKDTEPTTTTYDHRPYKVGNNETVLVESPAAGMWYIMLRGYTAFAGLTLQASYSASITVVTLSNGVPATGLSDTTAGEKYYKIEVPSGQTKLQISISGGTGDCDADGFFHLALLGSGDGRGREARAWRQLRVAVAVREFPMICCAAARPPDSRPPDARFNGRF